MSRCIDPLTLERFARGELPAPEDAAVHAHLETCRRCARALARLPIDDDLIGAIRDLDESRDQIDAALSGLRAVEERVTTTLFGRRSD